MIIVWKYDFNPLVNKMGPRGPIFFGTIFTQKVLEVPGFMYSSILMLENTWHHLLIWCGPNSGEIVNLFQFSLGPWGPTIGTKFPISSEFGPLRVKLHCDMFTNMKNDEYMESELSGIFRVKLVAKNILLVSLENQRQDGFAIKCLFLKKHTNFLNQTVTL